MSIVRKLEPISLEVYLTREERSPTRHEYIHGYLRAMTGSSDIHNKLAGRLYAALLSHLSDPPCETFISDMKLMTADRVYYPDVWVCCNDPSRDAYFRTCPLLIVEVLSPSTEATDRFEKLLCYQQLDSLQEYVLVAQDTVRVEVYRRAAGNWDLEICTEDDTVELCSIALALPIAEIYSSAIRPT